ncbi:MAG TPA: PAS domain-containing protein [Fibrobacteria bacterium]|nr:PAS domain-containing protein [Fibrobacteria bacterium]
MIEGLEDDPRLDPGGEGPPLAEQLRFAESLLNVTPGILYIYDLQERHVVFINARIQDLLGHSSREIHAMGGRVLEILMEPGDLARYRDEILPRYRQTKDFERVVHQYRMRHKDGRWHWVESTEVVYLRDVDGAPVQILGLGMDISERRRSEEAMRESEYFFRESQCASQTGSYRGNVTTGVWECSEVLAGIFGIDRSFQSDVDGWLRLVHPDDRAAMQAYYVDEVVAKRTRFDKVYRIVRPCDGDVRWVHGMGELVLDGQGAPLHIIGTIRDVTDRRRAEEALQRSEERLKLATQAGGIGIWDWDVERNILDWDDSMLAIYGLEAGRFEGCMEAWARGLHPDDRSRMERATRDAIEGRAEFAEEFRIVRPDGTERILKANSWSQRDARGRAVRMVGVNIDITERKRAQIELEHHRTHLEELVQERTAQLEAANRELESFCHTVSHDLRAPLRHLDGFTKLLLSECRQELSPDAARYVETIAGAARKMGVLIDDLLQFSRTSRQEMAAVSVDMDAVFNEARLQLGDPVAGDRKIDWVVGALPVVLGDHNLLRQVWANLLQNAVKYTRTRDVARIEVKSWSEGGEELFSISDNGVGFDMRYVGKLFGVFQRLHRQDDFEGTGIGLAIVQRILIRHGGRIWADATVDQGATFTFALPKAPGA